MRTRAAENQSDLGARLLMAEEAKHSNYFALITTQSARSSARWRPAEQVSACHLSVSPLKHVASDGSRPIGDLFAAQTAASSAAAALLGGSTPTSGHETVRSVRKGFRRSGSQATLLSIGSRCNAIGLDASAKCDRLASCDDEVNWRAATTRLG